MTVRRDGASRVDPVKRKASKAKYRATDNGRLVEKRYEQSRDKVKKAAHRVERRARLRSQGLAGAIDRRSHLRRYGLSEEAFQEMFAACEGCCQICGSLFDESSRPFIDHDHKKNKSARGLLCVHCNFLLGHAKESLEILHAAAEYLSNATN